MIRITTNFDSRKFMRELEKEVHQSAEKQVRGKLRDLAAKGLKIRSGPSHPSKFSMNLEGPEELIEEAKRRLG